MKKAFLVLTIVFAWISNITAQGTESKLIVDLDNDQINDTVYFNYEKSVIVCKLSSRDFKPLESKPVEIPDYLIDIDKSNDGFCFANHWQRYGFFNYFCYEPKTEKIHLARIERYKLDNSAEVGKGQSRLIVSTGEYFGTWNYYDIESDKYLEMPYIETTIFLKEFMIRRIKNVLQKYGLRLSKRVVCKYL